MSGASERANGRASGPVLQSVFLAVIDHSGGRRPKECFQDEGHNNGHDDHGDDVECHEENPGPVVGDTGVTLHDDEPIVDHSQLKKGYTRCRHVVEIVQPVVRVLG